MQAKRFAAGETVAQQQIQPQDPMIAITIERFCQFGDPLRPCFHLFQRSFMAYHVAKTQM